MDIPEHIELSLDVLLNLRAPGTYLARCDGDSMQDAGVFSGDILIVDKGKDAKAGSMIIALINQEPLLKFLCFVNGRPVLRSANKRFPDRYVLEGDEFAVWGVVTHSIRDHS